MEITPLRYNHNFALHAPLKNSTSPQRPSGLHGFQSFQTFKSFETKKERYTANAEAQSWKIRNSNFEILLCELRVSEWKKTRVTYSYPQEGECPGFIAVVGRYPVDGSDFRTIFDSFNSNSLRGWL